MKADSFPVRSTSTLDAGDVHVCQICLKQFSRRDLRERHRRRCEKSIGKIIPTKKRSCERCISFKVKCDYKKPSCTRCLHRSVDCTYDLEPRVKMPVNPAFLGTATAFSGSLDVFCVQSHHQPNMSSNNNFSFFEAQPDQFAAVTTPEMEIAFMASTTPAEAHTMGDGSPLSGYFTNSSTGSRNYYVNWRKQRSLSPGASGSTHAPHVSQCTPTGSSDSSSNLVDPALRHEATADWAADLLHTDAFGPHPMLSSQDLDKVLAERGIQSFSHQDMQTFSLQDMSLQDVQSMSLQEIQTMLYPDMQPLSHQDIQSLSPHDIQSLSPHDIQSLSPQDVPSSSHQEIQSLSNLNQDIETLSDHHQDAHRRSISFQDVQAMPHHIESLSNQNAQSMPHQDVPSMSHHIDSLPNQNHDERRRSISYEDIQSMSPQAIQAMSNQEMQSISLQAIQSMSNQDTTIAY